VTVEFEIVQHSKLTLVPMYTDAQISRSVLSVLGLPRHLDLVRLISQLTVKP
jgi:hypothetical protein